MPDVPSLMNDSPLPALRGPSAVEDGSFFLEVTEAKNLGFLLPEFSCLYCPNHRTALEHCQGLPQHQPDSELQKQAPEPSAMTTTGA